ncbi:MAG: alcohol dehydrogenase catalytic domain-containing protein [Candidatus Eremiobacteraeota bacterium]|nr:alcohol dehydrogenase catalytic domain-containing protein [Candidatus Eremiobacteraeota bacterium]
MIAAGVEQRRKTRAAFYEAGGRIVIKDLDLPPLKQGELLVRITACGMCASDALGWYAERKAPFVPGHEPVGVVEACGGDKTGFAPGDRVFVHHHAACMNCRYCRRGDYVQCPKWRAPRLFPGGLSALAIVASESVSTDVLALPDQMSDDVATLIEPLATVIKSLRRARLRPSDSVLIIGLGAMGLLHAMVARHEGAGVVLGTDRTAQRLERARGFGLDAVFDVGHERATAEVLAATNGDGADVVIVGPGSVEALEAAVETVARGGAILVFTPTAPEVLWQVPVHDLYFKDVRIITSYSAGPDDTRAALALLGAGLPVEQLFTHRLPLSETERAYRLLREAKEALKVVVYPNR